MKEFDDSRLEDPGLNQHEGLRWLACTGARVRKTQLHSLQGRLERNDRPRGVLVLGPEARLIRAVLEPVCPCPVMVWAEAKLPVWVGSLDLVVIVGDEIRDPSLLSLGAEARRRGAAIMVVAPTGSRLIELTSSNNTALVAVDEMDPMVAAMSLLSLLGEVGLGPEVKLDLVAAAFDLVAQICSPMRDLAVNPGKNLALQLADHVPLIWGGTTLARRAGRRFGEAIRRVSGVAALAADASELLAILRSVERRDPFADPEDYLGAIPVLVLLDAEKASVVESNLAVDLERTAEAVGVRVAKLSSGESELETNDLERYATLLSQCLYGAEYLGIGLG